MESNRLSIFRERLYACFTTGRDALMNLCDAVLSEPTARSFAEFSLSPHFVRHWSSLYAALSDGRVDRVALRKLLASTAPLPTAGKRLLLGIDASGIARPSSPTLKDRSSQYVHNLPDANAPVTAGWQFSALVALPETPSSWTYPLDNHRIATDQTPAEVAALQLRQIVPLLSAPPVTLGDRGYGSAAFVQATEGIACDLLLRLSSDRVFYRAAPPKTGKRGAPRKDGERFKCSDPSTHGLPDATWDGLDEKGRATEVSRWDGVHFRQFREQTVSVLRVIRHGAKGTKRDPKVSWFVWVHRTNAPDLAPSEVPSTYALRFSQEHGYRFDKGSLLWEKPRLRTPEAFQLWTDLVALAHDQLALARPLVEAQRQPWENVKRPATPQQVRRAMGRFLVELGTPARPAQRRGKSPGRPAGACIRLAPRFLVVKKIPKTSSPKTSSTPLLI